MCGDDVGASERWCGVKKVRISRPTKFMAKTKSKAPTLSEQIKAVQASAKMARYSFTHLIGKYKGRIPPGPELDETLALEAAVKTLSRIEKLP